MPTLDDYKQFQGLHWETGSLRNALAHLGVTAPHTGDAYSEALFLGVSGGIAMGYFAFDYEGYDPWVRILSRNTFDPMETIFNRLDIEVKVLQTTSPEKGEQNLVEVLESGLPAIIYADMFSLPYNALSHDEGMWAMLPILVFGFDVAEDLVSIADRARVPLSVSVEALAAARSRTKKNKFRLLTVGAPKVDRVKSAVEAGIRDCIQLFTQPPPKGSKNNFGFLAFKKWIDLLINPNRRDSWAKEFAPGRKMYAGLSSAFESITIFGKNGGAERDVYAQFLEEASAILEKPALADVAEKFRASANAWDQLSAVLLPDDVPQFKETRDLMLEKHNLFLAKGNAALGEINQKNERLEELKTEMDKAFPLSNAQSGYVRESIAEQIRVVRDIELDAVRDLQANFEWQID